jgi:uncharacterized protein YcfJ
VGVQVALGLLVVGTCVGKLVGRIVGENVGVNVGAKVGAQVGMTGAGTGDCVGEGVVLSVAHVETMLENCVFRASVCCPYVHVWT